MLTDLHFLPSHVLPDATLPIPYIHGHFAQTKSWVFAVQVVHQVPLCCFESWQRSKHVGESLIVSHVDLQHGEVVQPSCCVLFQMHGA